MARRVLEFLISRKLSLVLFGALCALSIPGTFTEDRTYYAAAPFRAVLGLLGLNLLLCTWKRFHALSRPVLIVHSGVLLTLAGGLVSTFGFVATVNVYEAGSVDRAYRWDKQADVPLGMELTAARVHSRYYPVQVRVGVLKGGERAGLFTLRTGESFSLGPYTVIAEGLALPDETLKLSVHLQGRSIGRADTAGHRDLPSDFPYSFVLVAFKNPVLERTWVDLVLTRGGAVIAEGPAEVNGPFQWQGLYFYHTRTDRDAYGRVYAGIQIVRDPGRPVVFAGFCVIMLGSLIWMQGRLSRQRSLSVVHRTSLQHGTMKPAEVDTR
jgi:hypothetical protein